MFDIYRKSSAIKCFLFHKLYHYATKICTPEILSAEVGLFKSVLRSNNCTERFVEKLSTWNNVVDAVTNVPGSTLYEVVAFKMVKNTNNTVLWQNYYVAQVFMKAITWSTPLPLLLCITEFLMATFCFEIAVRCGVQISLQDPSANANNLPNTLLICETL